ncbi:MAG: hypothetical protein HYU64_15870 [Armatimonadetes bacterium]|nr:hypothetical protein [Armatimonadota bacterium]
MAAPTLAPLSRIEGNGMSLRMMSPEIHIYAPQGNDPAYEQSGSTGSQSHDHTQSTGTPSLPTPIPFAPAGAGPFSTQPGQFPDSQPPLNPFGPGTSFQPSGIQPPQSQPDSKSKIQDLLKQLISMLQQLVTKLGGSQSPSPQPPNPVPPGQPGAASASTAATAGNGQAAAASAASGVTGNAATGTSCCCAAPPQSGILPPGGYPALDGGRNFL